MLLLDRAALDARLVAIRGPLASLYASLTHELEPVLARPLYVPESKALLSRQGGRCAVDGTTLEFDPASPHEHRCGRCGVAYRGELHHRAWIMWYQLWLAERAVHSALFFLLRGEPRHGDFARRVLLAYGDRYLRYPNRDNVLGPSRLFFSTYLESIWLLQICIAADLLAEAGDTDARDRVRAMIVEPASALIAQYDEGLSNRQVWNNAALVAAASLQGDDAMFDRALTGSSGLERHVDVALLADGTWYEGENYHLFALRGLWYCVTMAEARGRRLSPDRYDRFLRAFAAPFVTALPDFTMPARKDSQYAVSLRQWRIAELAELGFARSRVPVLGGALARCYEAGHARGETGRSRSAADVERNGPPSALSRADLGWRALLHALPELPPLIATSPRSALLEAQGYAVFRRESDVYVGVEFGQSGGGHGHPDRLNVTLHEGATRWLDDLGTGSYVDPSLHWYRSTLAHNAPLVEGHSQPLCAGTLRAYDEREGLGWLVAELAFDDVRLERTIVVAPDYLVDELRWSAPRELRVELPWHLDHEGPEPGATSSVLDGGTRPEDGFAHVRDAVVGRLPATELLTHRVERDGRRLVVLHRGDHDMQWFDACAPGQPSSVSRRFYLLRARGRAGVFRSVVSWSPQFRDADVGDDSITVHSGAERHVHTRTREGWRVELFAGAARSSIDLGGWRTAATGSEADRAEDRRASRDQRAVVVAMQRGVAASAAFLSDLSARERTALTTIELGEAHYRRSELSWGEAACPRATVAFAADAARLIVHVAVLAGDPHFAHADAENPYDNEHPDTMRAGVQLYLSGRGAVGAWMLVPEPVGPAVRVRRIEGWPGGEADERTPTPAARWQPRDAGYELRIEVPLPLAADARERLVDVDVLINETTVDRERRRGQLVLSGARGEFVYLRGDRHDPARLLRLAIRP